MGQIFFESNSENFFFRGASFFFIFWREEGRCKVIANSFDLFFNLFRDLLTKIEPGGFGAICFSFHFMDFRLFLKVSAEKKQRESKSSRKKTVGPSILHCFFPSFLVQKFHHILSFVDSVSFRPIFFNFKKIREKTFAGVPYFLFRIFRTISK